MFILIPLFGSRGANAAAAPVYAWGNNQFGQLGNGTRGIATRSNTPTAVAGLEHVSAAAAGSEHSLARRNDGTVVAWGWNISGQLGDGTYTDRYTPVAVVGLTGIVGIAAGGEHSLALHGDGTVAAWGSNAFGQLGGNQPFNPLAGPNAPVAVIGLTDVIAVAAGGNHSLALRRDGTVFAWGITGTAQGTKKIPVPVAGVANIVAIAAGSGHSLALRADGAVLAWGGNDKGQLGDGTETTRTDPVSVGGLGAIVAVAAGVGHSLALGRDGTVLAWGDNYLDQLGTTGYYSRATPAAVPGVVGAIGIAAGGYTSFARREGGTVLAWGENVYGEMGTGTSSRTERPHPIPGLESVIAIAGGTYHVVAATGPLPPSFADVPVGYWAHDPIVALARRGITTGCGDDDLGRRLYCPERGVTRAEMAAFLDRTLGYGSPATPASQRFSDVPPNYWAYALIDQFAKLGITTGCGGTEFCPDRGVTRAEMAAFVIRALKKDQLTPATPTFADVPSSHPQYGFVEALVSLGATTGCGTNERGQRLYCPDRGVTRAEMAAFIIRAFP